MARVYTLKHATPKMKYQHMRNVMEFKADLKDKAENPPDRHVALGKIHTLMGGNFHAWYDVVYKLRADNQNEAYEQAIFTKLEALQAEATDEQTPSAAFPKTFNWKAVSASTLRTYTAQKAEETNKKRS